jgi:hypothetical protein
VIFWTQVPDTLTTHTKTYKSSVSTYNQLNLESTRNQPRFLRLKFWAQDSNLEAGSLDLVVKSLSRKFAGQASHLTVDSIFNLTWHYTFSGQTFNCVIYLNLRCHVKFKNNEILESKCKFYTVYLSFYSIFLIFGFSNAFCFSVQKCIGHESSVGLSVCKVHISATR